MKKILFLLLAALFAAIGFGTAQQCHDGSGKIIYDPYLLEPAGDVKNNNGVLEFSATVIVDSVDASKWKFSTEGSVPSGNYQKGQRINFSVTAPTEKMGFDLLDDSGKTIIHLGNDCPSSMFPSPCWFMKIHTITGQNARTDNG
jgi:hypothetical protein